MENNEKLNQNLLEIKIKVMTQRIEKLKGMYQILFSDSEMKKQKSLEVIKNQYISICNVIIRRKEYEKYKEIENIIVKGIAKIEFDLDKKIYSTEKYYWNIVINIIQEIKGSKNYKNFCHIEKEIEKIENLKELVKLYTPYINESEIKRTQDRNSTRNISNESKLITRWNFEKNN